MFSRALLPLFLSVVSLCNFTDAKSVKPIKVAQMAPKEASPPPPPPRNPRIVKRRSIFDRLAEQQAQVSAGSLLKPWQQQQQQQEQQDKQDKQKQHHQEQQQERQPDFPLIPQQQEQQQQQQQTPPPPPQRLSFMEHFCTKVLQDHSITNGLEISTKKDIKHIEELYRKCSLLHLLNVNDDDGDGDDKVAYVEMKMSDLDKNAKFDFIFLEDPADIPLKFDLLRKDSSILFGQGAEGCRRFVVNRKKRIIRPNNTKAFYDDENDLYFIVVGGAKDV